MTEIPSIGTWASNAELIADGVRPLGWLPDDALVLDCTYGKGRFWTKYRPPRLVGVDLNPLKAEHVQADFVRLPFPDHCFDVVVFDPDYKLCLDYETEILTRRGWLRYDEVVVGDQAYSMCPETGFGHWKPIAAVHVYPVEPTKVAVCAAKNLDFIATPHHRWPVVSAKGRRTWKTTDALSWGDRVVHAASWADTPTELTIPDAMVELVAWYWTEGTRFRRGSTYGSISQSLAANPEMCGRIQRCLTELYGEPVDAFPRTGRSSTPMWRVDDRHVRNFIFSAAVGADLETHAPNRIPTTEFVAALTAEQRALFITTSLQADGQSMERLSQSDPARAEAFLLACILDGRPVSYLQDPNGHTVTIKRRAHTKPLRSGMAFEERLVGVWCPTVEGASTWLARRNGRIYFTGNSGTPALDSFDEAYGIDVAKTTAERMAGILEGAEEAARVCRKHLLIKCQDQVVSGEVRFQTIELHTLLTGLEPNADIKGDRPMRLAERFDFPTNGIPQPSGRTQRHARHDHSQLLVFTRTRRSQR